MLQSEVTLLYGYTSLLDSWQSGPGYTSDLEHSSVSLGKTLTVHLLTQGVYMGTDN